MRSRQSLFINNLMRLKYLTILMLFPFLGISQINSSIDLISGVEYSYRVLYPSGGGSFGKMFIEVRKGEQSKFNYRYGLNYNRRLSDKFHLRTGIRFLQGGYKSKKITDLRWGSENSGGAWVQDPNLPHEIQFIYNFLFLELPIVARWERKGEKFNLFLETGLAPTLYLTTKTRQITDLDAGEFETMFNESLSQLQVVGLVSVGANYNLNKSIQLFAQPILRGHLTQQVYNVGIKEHLINMGIEFGLRRKIN